MIILTWQACTAHKVVAMNTPGQNSNAVAELVFEMMLYQARGGFSGKSGSELRGKTIGIHAFGNVGKYVAEIARGFGMDIYAYDPLLMKMKLKVGVLKSAEQLKNYIQNASIFLAYACKRKNQKINWIMIF